MNLKYYNNYNKEPRVWADIANQQCRRCNLNTGANMSNCMLCTNDTTCTKCDDLTFLDTYS